MILHVNGIPWPADPVPMDLSPHLIARHLIARPAGGRGRNEFIRPNVGMVVPRLTIEVVLHFGQRAACIDGLG